MRKRRKSGSSAAVTVDEVARLSGVSVATVSRTLNTPERVRADTRERVEAAVRETGYLPNFAARALASNKTGTVGAIIPTLNNAIFAQGVNAFERALREKNYTLLVAVSNYDEATELTNLNRMVERKVDALMLVGTDHSDEAIATLRRIDIPYVCTWAFAPNVEMPTVGFDNRSAMHAVVEHLTAEGHTAFAMLAGITRGNDRARERVAGVVAALEGHGLALAPQDMIEVAYSVDEAKHQAIQLLGRRDRPTAIICGNDVIAYGVLFAAAELGLSVPADVSVVGFDDLELSAQMPPGLTTVRVPAAQMGETAAHNLAGVLEGDDGAAASVELQTELVVRGTTGPVRAKTHLRAKKDRGKKPPAPAREEAGTERLER